jgi:hypothetical protein
LLRVFTYLGLGELAAPASSVLYIGTLILFGSGSAVRFYRADIQPSPKSQTTKGIGGRAGALQVVFTKQQAGPSTLEGLAQRRAGGQRARPIISPEKLGVIGGKAWAMVVMHGFQLLDAQKPARPGEA